MTGDAIVFCNVAQPAPVELDASWIIFNAPRALPGTVTWTGEYRHGIYYAAGPGADISERCRELDGWEVRFISNDDIRARISEMCLERGETLAEILESFDDDWSALARACDLRWSPEP